MIIVKPVDSCSTRENSRQNTVSASHSPSILLCNPFPAPASSLVAFKSSRILAELGFLFGVPDERDSEVKDVSR